MRRTTSGGLWEATGRQHKNQSNWINVSQTKKRAFCFAAPSGQREIDEGIAHLGHRGEFYFPGKKRNGVKTPRHQWGNFIAFGVV